MEKEGVKRFTVRIPDSLSKELKFQAIEEDRTQNAIVLELIENYLQKIKKTQ